MKSYVITAAIIRRGDKILLINHGPEYGSSSYWCLPGGTAEEHENAFECMLREVKEETGLEPKNMVKVAFLTQHINEKRDWQSIVLTYEFSIAEDDQININDPDREILSADFFTTEEAIEKLKGNPFLIMREPLEKYLLNKKSKIWTYLETEFNIELLGSQDLA